MSVLAVLEYASLRAVELVRCLFFTWPVISGLIIWGNCCLLDGPKSVRGFGFLCNRKQPPGLHCQLCVPCVAAVHH